MINYDSLSEKSKAKIMQAMGHKEWCDMDPNTHKGCTCDAALARSCYQKEGAEECAKSLSSREHPDHCTMPYEDQKCDCHE